ncbi:MAG TPA: metalloregulator ArsR/SmtB family transcription factor [Candidatus Dormibacteraeota bacterium]|nr:metalloregulator ArsR/SmtB family transcription factor [Candidatus Dormibacteraeota bacterium]
MISEGSEPIRVEVRASAPLELMWIVHNCEAGHELDGPMASLDEIRVRLGPKLKSFWGDGVRGFTEAVVLAERSGAMFDLDLERFFSKFDQAAMVGGNPSLLSESASERRAMHTRLERLRTDAPLRAEYRALLQSAWEPVRVEWETAGKAAVLKEVADWERRLAGGTGYRALLERERIWPGRPELEDLADAAAAEGRLVLTPGWFFGLIHVVEIDGTLYLGRRFRTPDQEGARRHLAKEVAANLKVLADPTRVAIVLWLASHPASITEIAKHFKLSQPTVSGHVQVLREGGLLEEKAAGRSSTLTVTERRVKDLLAGVEDALLRQFPKD